jgi:AGZA family xanthine/uracil permease-like MFS transporter
LQYPENRSFIVDRFFSLSARGTTPRTEIMAGLATFLTMAYIVVVNPGMMAAAGIDHGAAFVATCLAAAIGSALMALLANYPIALAPGMGLNAYFAFVVVGAMGVPWPVALGAVFLSGLLFFAVSMMGFREWLINSIPFSLKLGIAAGIGLFLGLIGLREMGLVVDNPATLVGLGNVHATKTILSCIGFLLVAGLVARGVTGGIVIGIAVTALLGVPFGLTTFNGIFALPPSLAPTFMQMDIKGAIGLGLAGIVFTFFMVDLLDNAGTLIATTHRAGLMEKDGSVPQLGRALMADSGGAMIGAVLGTSTTVSYIESAAGVQAGGRTGLTALTVAGLFLLTLFLAPLATSIPAFATAPALVLVACLMTQGLRDLAWDDMTEYLPAMVTAVAMPFTFSIATGIGLGFVTYALVKVIAGRAGQVHGAVWLIAVLSAAKFWIGT